MARPTSRTPPPSSPPFLPSKLLHPDIQLFRARDIYNPSEANARMRRSAHGAMLPRGVDGGGGAGVGRHVSRGPARELELRVPRAVVHGDDAVAILADGRPRRRLRGPTRRARHPHLALRRRARGSAGGVPSLVM
ncbi:hypothetical protein CIB48_g4731 [Xylaria polymorpha]|nr:hypothetical protein CIB48_g4731 [Xylaria polymorpha]